MAKSLVGGKDDDIVRVPSRSWLGKGRRLKRRFISSGHQLDQAERSRSRSRSQPVEEEEGGREKEADRDSDSHRRDELNPSEEELKEQDRDRSASTKRYGDQYAYGRSWSPPYGWKVGSLEFTLTDPDVFDCAVCLEPLTSPVYQCENGHIACSSCCKKIRNGCPSCSMPIGNNRCCAIEKVLESVRMACRNTKFGCNEKFRCHMKNDHEKTCQFAPCSCPFPSCSCVGSFSELVSHLSSMHAASPTSFRFNFKTSLLINIKVGVLLLKEERQDVLFVLENETIDLGSKIKISCIGPLPKTDYSYDIEANYRESSIKLHTCTKSVPEFECDPKQDPCLLVPRGFFDDSLGLKLEVCIWRGGARA